MRVAKCLSKVSSEGKHALVVLFCWAKSYLSVLMSYHGPQKSLKLAQNESIGILENAANDWGVIKSVRNDTSKMVANARKKYLTNLDQNLTNPMQGPKTY